MNFRNPKYSLRKNRPGLTFIIAALLGSVASDAVRAAEHPEEDEFRIPAHSEPAIEPGLKTEIAAYAQLATEAADQGKWPLADHFLKLLVGLPCSEGEKKTALREIAESYERHKQIAKALAMYEKMIEIFARDPDLPELLFKVGILYRETGAYGRAVSRFYSVLNTALKVNERGVNAYQELSQRAQLEIAETHFMAGDYRQANKFYQLLDRGDLAGAQKARVQFRALHCSFLLDDLPAAIATGEKFLRDFPDDASSPEGRYLFASALRSAKRKQESFDAVIALLRVEKEKRGAAPERWSYWQKKTGNEFANEYYKQGDFLSALTIYQTLAKLGEDPDWQWPVIYQIGLCFERLRLVKRAGEAYKYILDQAEKTKGATPALPEHLTNLAQMARWRGEQLAWQFTADAQLQRVLGAPQSLPPLTGPKLSAQP